MLRTDTVMPTNRSQNFRLEIENSHSDETSNSTPEPSPSPQPILPRNSGVRSPLSMPNLDRELGFNPKTLTILEVVDLNRNGDGIRLISPVGNGTQPREPDPQPTTGRTVVSTEILATVEQVQTVELDDDPDICLSVFKCCCCILLTISTAVVSLVWYKGKD